ncbi:MAG: TetR/AcrR family transcriptional regulator [Chryseolinea sp.]
MSLRKEKAARLKVHVLDQTLKLIGKKSFEDLYVDDICARAKISKVTLFKYFPQKEDILLYYFRIWCMSRCVELSQKPREGTSGLIYLFDKLGDTSEEHPGLMLAVLGYLSDMRRSPKPFPIKLEEKKLLFPEVTNISAIELLSLDQMVEKFVLEGIFRKEITRSTNTRDITHLLLATFMGGIVIAHTNHMQPLKMYYRRNVEMLLKGLQN